jgi:hypothetical protein
VTILNPGDGNTPFDGTVFTFHSLTLDTDVKQIGGISGHVLVPKSVPVVLVAFSALTEVALKPNHQELGLVNQSKLPVIFILFLAYNKKAKLLQSFKTYMYERFMPSVWYQ